MPRSEYTSNHPPPRYNIRQRPLRFLHLLKPNKPTSLTLQMIEKPRQRNKLFPTLLRQIRTMINTLLMHRRIGMLVQRPA